METGGLSYATGGSVLWEDPVAVSELVLNVLTL